MQNPIHDFGYDSRIGEMTISRYADKSTPTAHHRLIVTIESGTTRRRFSFVNPEPLSDVSGMIDAWAFRILDQRLDGENFIEFGRYWLEYVDDDDNAPRHIQADTFEELLEPESRVRSAGPQ
jgi:hypothetical protein